MCFNTQPPEGGWARAAVARTAEDAFQHTAARRRLVEKDGILLTAEVFQHTAARRRLVYSKHESRYKTSFNTQPPEGGWPFLPTYHKRASCFNTQPPEGGWSVLRCLPSMY